MNTVHQYAYEAEYAPRQQEQFQTSAAPQSAARAAIVTVAVAMLVFLTLIGLIYVKYSVMAMQLQINQLQNSIEDKAQQASRLEARIHEMENVAVIREKAEALGMGYPDAEHVLWVDLSSPVSSSQEVLEAGE